MPKTIKHACTRAGAPSTCCGLRLTRRLLRGRSRYASRRWRSALPGLLDGVRSGRPRRGSCAHPAGMARGYPRVVRATSHALTTLVSAEEGRSFCAEVSGACGALSGLLVEVSLMMQSSPFWSKLTSHPHSRVHASDGRRSSRNASAGDAPLPWQLSMLPRCRCRPGVGAWGPVGS